jgi:hypothetical protein
MSADGKRVWFTSKQRLVAADTDDAQDIYESRVASSPGLVGGAPGPLHVTEGAPPAALVPGLDVTDDYGELFGAVVQITGEAAPADALAAGAHPGLTATLAPAGDRLSFAGRAPLSVYRDALRAVTFTSAEEAAGAPRTVTITVDNGGATGSVGRTVILDGINDAPTVAFGQPPGEYVENSDPLAVAPAVTLADVDSATLAAATVRLADPVAGEDQLTARDVPGLALTVAADRTSVTFTGDAAPAAYRDALRSVAYRNASEAPDTRTRQIEIAVDDGAGATSTATGILAVRAVNDAPVVTTSEPIQEVAASATVPVDDALNVTDVDSATLAGATVRIASGYAADADRLSVAAPGGLSATVSSGEVRLTGAAPTAAYIAALRSVAFSSTGRGARALTVTVDDGAATSVAGVRAVQVEPLAAPDPGPALPARRGQVRVARTVLLEGRTLHARCVLDRPAITGCRVSVYLRIGGELVKVGSARHRPDAHGLRSVQVTVAVDERGLRTILRRHGRAAALVRATIYSWPGPRTFRPQALTILRIAR